MRQTFADTMLEVGRQDQRLVVLIGDISHFILQPFAKACPGRFYNVGICESTIVSMAAGLAHVGLRPVAHTIAPFLLERSFEQIKLDFCYQELGGTLITVGSAFDYSGLGCSHFCYDDFALIKALPGTEVVHPAMPNELNLLFKETYTNRHLTYFRLTEYKHGVTIPDNMIRLGKAVVLKPGRDVTVVAVGAQLRTVMAGLPAMANAGLDPEVVYVHTIKPFDYATVAESIHKTTRYLVIEEHARLGGVGDEVVRAVLNMGAYQAAFIAIPDQFSHHYGTYEQHCAAFGMTPGNVVEQVRRLCR